MPPSPSTSPLDGSLGLFLLMLFLVLLLVAAACIVLYRIHIPSVPATTTTTTRYSLCRLLSLCNPLAKSNEPKHSPQIPAIVVSCSPSIEKPAFPFRFPHITPEHLQVPGNRFVAPRDPPTTPCAKPVLPAIKPLAPLAVISNNRTRPRRPYEITAPPPALTGHVRRVSVKRHGRNSSITSLSSASGKENSFGSLSLQPPAMHRTLSRSQEFNR
ncbi:hypothetical protein BXZ70DRAFT_1009373 [Cristinia sonorae]|uniref:Uncharacterized protein n=1 Tax=Cristinia sonorae TaxID=1940300 RepID=A0A8K0UKH3_9AGAR|nr:hypothetical protein BXZ70DRAFT_1009373 [Cristinia sonorae]